MGTTWSGAAIFFCVILCGDILEARHEHLTSKKGRRLFAEGNINLTSAILLAQNVANLVYQRFEYHNFLRYQFFIGSSNMPDTAWDIMKYKFAKKIVAGNAQFLMIFGGSSVTAGHDNFFSQSYPLVFERRMKPVFDALGVKLLVRNIAMGANNCRPSNLCYEAQGGNDPDWLGWEQSYNCGKDRGVFENIARVAYWNKAVVHFSASGAFAPSECLPSKDPVPWINEEWTPEIAGITSRHAPNRTDVARLRSLLHDWFQDGNAVARFTDSLGEGYRSVGYHGFSVWGKTRSLCFNDYTNQSGCDAINMRGRCYDAGGPHWMIKETSLYGQEGGRGSSWHPPAGMHLVRGETMVYNYVNILLDAIYTVEDDLKVKSRNQAEIEYQEKLDKLQGIPLPAAHHCKPECVTRPVCFTNYQPHYNSNHTLDKVIVGKLAPEWKVVYKEGGGPNPAKHGYLDRKPNYETQDQNVEMHLKVRVGKARHIKICGYSTKESLKHASFFLDPNVTFPEGDPGDKYVPSAQRVKITDRKYVGDECTQLSHLPTGDHVVSVATPSSGRHTVTVTHLITWL